MKRVNFKKLFLKKKFPLKISRGTFSGAENLFVLVSNGQKLGLGEMCPGVTEGAKTAEVGQNSLEEFLKYIQYIPDSILSTYLKAVDFGVPPCAIAALDMALWDLRAKEANMSLYRLLGLGLPTVSTSVTIGIMSAEQVKDRIIYLGEKGMLDNLKIKLGSPDGLDHDKEMFSQLFELLKNSPTKLRVDANGGWSVKEAKGMLIWLNDRNVDYVEQPLAKGQEENLKFLFNDRPLPIFVDESCRNGMDIPSLAQYVDGVNLKLMKCGGITEALRMVGVARAHKLKTMIGCMGESSISISAGAAIGSLFDYIDLDSHLNLDPDPTEGAPLVNGIITPKNIPGHGGSLRNA